MNVAIVGGCLPYPPTSGSRLRTLNLAARLARRHRLTFLAAANPDRAEAEAALAHLRGLGIEAREVGRPAPPKSGPAFYARLAANLASPLPYSVASHHRAELAREVDRLGAGRAIDLWQAEWVGAALALRGVPPARTVVMAPNVETLIWERHAAAQPDPVRRWYVAGQCRKYERFERRALRRAGRVVAVSPDDAALVRDRFGVPGGRVDVVDNGIDRTLFERPAHDDERDPKRILFLGSLDWRPNLDAVGLLLDRIFPEVRAADPLATLEVVGRSPPPSLARRVLATPGAALHADVVDVRPFLGRAGVMAVPLRVGGGSRLKILEALAAGLPVVSTRVGAEGLELTPGLHLDVAEGVGDMAGALLAALREPGRVRAAAARARPFVLGRYDWGPLADRLEACWERCLASACDAGRRPLAHTA